MRPVFAVCIVLIGLSPGCGPAPSANVPTPNQAEAGPPASPPSSASPQAQPATKSTPSDPRPNQKGSPFLDAAEKYEGKSLAEWIALLGDKDDLVRSDAADAVAKYGPNAKAAVPALVALLKNPDDLSFIWAAMAIGKIGPAAGDAVDPLIALLKHKDASTRGLVAGVLGDLGPPAGKAVPALIAALEGAKSGTEKDRDAFRFPIQQLGKYDIRAVYAAVRQDKLTEFDLGQIIETLGPDDDHAVAGLVEELKGREADPITDNWHIYTMGGLKRIGPKAAPALPELKILLKDKSEIVRGCAAEAIAVIGAGDGKDAPTSKSPKKDDPPADISEVLERAGFNRTRVVWGRLPDLAWYVRFGSKPVADKYTRGDQFDKLEAEKAARGHRDDLRQRRFRLSMLTYVPAVRADDIEAGRIVVNVALPMRVRGDKPFADDPAGFTGVLAAMHPSEADPLRYWFLTKDGDLRACNPAEAAFVKRNGGVLYHPEVANTTLALVVTGTPEVLKDMARNAKEYTVEVDFSDLRYERPLAWGFFRQDAYLDAGRDCQKLWMNYLLDKASPQPVYFPTAFADTNPEKIPEIVRASLDALRVRDKDGKVVGSYRAK